MKQSFIREKENGSTLVIKLGHSMYFEICSGVKTGVSARAIPNNSKLFSIS